MNGNLYISGQSKHVTTGAEPLVHVNMQQFRLKNLCRPKLTADPFTVIIFHNKKTQKKNIEAYASCLDAL